MRGVGSFRRLPSRRTRARSRLGRTFQRSDPGRKRFHFQHVEPLIDGIDLGGQVPVQAVDPGADRLPPRLPLNGR